MTDNTSWSLLGNLDDFPNGGKRNISVGETDIIVCRVYSDIYAFRNQCPHLNKPLAAGRFQGYEFVCPHHNACFDVRSGEPQSGPAVTPLVTYPCKVEGGKVYLDINSEDTRNSGNPFDLSLIDR